MSIEGHLDAAKQTEPWDELKLRINVLALSEDQRFMTPLQYVEFLSLCQRQQHQRMERVLIRKE